MSRHREATWRTFEYNKIIGIWPNEGVGNSCGYAPMAKVVGDKRWMTDEKRREIAELMASAPDLKKENERLREALGTISATESIADINPSVDVKMMWIGCVHIARAALKKGE